MGQGYDYTGPSLLTDLGLFLPNFLRIQARSILNKARKPIRVKSDSPSTILCVMSANHLSDLTYSNYFRYATSCNILSLRVWEERINRAVLAPRLPRLVPYLSSAL